MAVRYTKPLDGGFGWVVVLAVFMIGACTMGLTRSFGVFFKEFATQFNQPATATSWVISICTGTTLGGALVGVWLSTIFGFRPVAMVGGVVAGIGCILASFATSIVHLYLTVGILVGFGSSLAIITSLSLVGKYFDSKRAIANGIAMSGICLGNIVFPPVFTYLIEEYGWRGSFLIAAGVLLNVTAFAALLRPINLRVSPESQPSNTSAKTVETETYNREACFKQIKDNPLWSVAIIPSKQSRSIGGITLSMVVHKARPFCTYWRTTLAEFKTLLIYPPLVCINLAQICFLGFGLFTPIVHIAPRARHLGIEQYQSAFLVSMISIGDLIGRLLSGFLPTFRRFGHFHWYILFVLMTGVASLMSLLANTYPTLAVYCITLGLLIGAAMTMVLTVLAEIVGPARLSNAIGLMTLLMSITVIGGPPIAGKLYDTTRDYDMSFVVAGCGPILGGLAAAVLCCLGDESARRVSGRESSSAEPIEEEPANLLNVDEKEGPVPFAIETSV